MKIKIMISLPFVFITLPLFYKVLKYSLVACVLSNVGFLKNAPWLLCVLSSHVMCYLSVSCLMSCSGFCRYFGWPFYYWLAGVPVT